ncbi:hypothetical protein Adt_14230 [Abeliophyllum distichum]|uniref:Uncharacterized protein n=1 Tax=Abeliophyllum distichum TaxID=126358 RepID=A0ABD1TZQ2_9LAMI
MAVATIAGDDENISKKEGFNSSRRDPIFCRPSLELQEEVQNFYSSRLCHARHPLFFGPKIHLSLAPRLLAVRLFFFPLQTAQESGRDGVHGKHVVGSDGVEEVDPRTSSDISTTVAEEEE